MTKTINWIGYLTIAFASYFLGIVSAELLGKSDIDASLAGLIGAALGAAVTVFGTVWVARNQIGQGELSLKRLIADSTAAIRDEAYLLVSLTEKDEIENTKSYAAQLLEQIDLLQETFDLFERNLGVGNIADYDIRLWIFRLENAIKKNLRVFEKEKLWLIKPTSAVIENSKGDLALSAVKIFDVCVAALRELGDSPALPTKTEIRKRIELPLRD